MKLSELTPEVAAGYAVTDADEVLLPLFLDAARYHVLSYTGLTTEQADEKPDLTVAALALVTEMVDNRQLTTENDKINKVLSSFMDSHSVNLL